MSDRQLELQRLELQHALQRVTAVEEEVRALRERVGAVETRVDAFDDAIARLQALRDELGLAASGGRDDGAS